ncbi:MAG: cytochrome P450 [Halioglobus sp.]
MTAAGDAPAYLVTPKPPIVQDELAHIGAGLRFARSPTGFLAELRAEYGDTFLVDVFGYKLFCVFSPAGLCSLYAAEERDASFGMATFDMLGFKTPIEVMLDADIALFYELLQPPRVAAGLHTIAEGIAEVLEDWKQLDTLDVFDAVRTLQQRVGFRLWIGPEAARDGEWQAFKACFDVLSQENAFVSPQQTLETLMSNKAAEKQAVSEFTQRLGAIVEQRDAAGAWPDDNLSFLHARFRSETPEATLRKLAHNVINANQGFLSNLYAALGWTLVNLQSHPDSLRRLHAELDSTRARYGEQFYTSQTALDSMPFCEQLLMESVRFAQRSLTLRKVMREMAFTVEDQVYTLAPGVYIATMLSVTNVDSPELARFDPDHYVGRRINPALIGKGRETVSTFGHGTHACPAQKFSHNMCKVLLAQLYAHFQLGAPAVLAAPSDTQMGGVARPAEPVRLAIRAR